MKNLLLILISLSFFYGCQNTYQARKSVSISIKNYELKNLSIRAIDILNDTSVLFAASNGAVGTIGNSGYINIKNRLILDTIIPNFRAVGHTSTAYFAISIENPALLFKIENAIPQLVYKEENTKVFYDALQFFDDKNGIAMGDPTGNCLSVLLTNDGGESWNKILCDNLPEVSQGEAAFAASNTNIAVYNTNAWIATGGTKARVFHTPDMGLTWNVYPTPIIQGAGTSGIYSIAFYNDLQGIICGGDFTDKFGKSANKALTFDGGKTWEIVAENKAPFYVSCVQYIPNTKGKELMAVSTNGIYFSNDSGRSWNEISAEGYYAIKFVSKNKAWLSGDQVIASMKIN